MAVVQEAFVSGVSTRKIERLARAMGIENISASQVSEFNKELDAQVADLRFPDVVHCLEEGLEDSLSFYDFPNIDKKRIFSTNG